MTVSSNIVAIYDFELFPYALGDVLTWNVRTAMRCEELGRERVDIYICADKHHPAGIYQRGLVNPENFELFFSELYGAFGTHPRLGDIHIFRQREALLARLEEIVLGDEVNAEAVEDYLAVLEFRVSNSLIDRVRRTLARTILGSQTVRRVLGRCLPRGMKDAVLGAGLIGEAALNQYFIKYIHSHESINAFAASRGGIPLLKPALGCAPDIDELITQRFAGKRIVPFHLRLRRLDFGYGGDHSYDRDSNFVEWYDFLRRAGARYPDVEFVALGRLQEKPLELLRLPNVTSLRIFGMGLGHELTLMLKSDLFIGTSSGFAALANFSVIPYFITRMNPGSCRAYAIPQGAERLPFALETQRLIYAQETSELLMSLLETGLGFPPNRTNHLREEGVRAETQEIDIRGWLRARSQPMNSAATTSRFYADDKYRDQETAYLILPALERARLALLENRREDARVALRRLEDNFSSVCQHFRQYRLLKEVVSDEDMDLTAMRAFVDTLDIRLSDIVGRPCSPSASESTAWRPYNWVVESGASTPLSQEPQPALTLRATGPGCYWHTERFVSSRPDGRIAVYFDAKNSEASSRHRVWIFEDGSYRSVGEFVADTDWQTFEIAIAAKPGAVLEFQIDQVDDWQSLLIRNVHVIDGGPLPLVCEAPVAVSMACWTGEEGVPCVDAAGSGHDCRQWTIAGKTGFVQTPALPQPGEGGLLIRFDARTDRHATAFTPIYLFEGKKYRTVAQYALGPDWRQFALLLEADRTVPIKVQVDYPESVGFLSIRNCQAVQVGRTYVASTRESESTSGTGGA